MVEQSFLVTTEAQSCCFLEMKSNDGNKNSDGLMVETALDCAFAGLDSLNLMANFFI